MAAAGGGSADAAGAGLEALREWRDGVVAERGASMSAWTSHWLSDATLRRYLAAERGALDQAKRRLLQTAEWRAKHVVSGARCPECADKATSHCIVSLGLGRGGMPVVYSSPPRAESTAAASAVAHVTCELEKGFALDGCTGRWVWLVDMRGYTLWSSMANTASGSEMARVFSAHYPERLGAVVLLEPPAVFQVLLTVSWVGAPPPRPRAARAGRDVLEHRACPARAPPRGAVPLTLTPPAPAPRSARRRSGPFSTRGPSPRSGPCTAARRWRTRCPGS